MLVGIFYDLLSFRNRNRYRRIIKGNVLRPRIRRR